MSDNTGWVQIPVPGASAPMTGYLARPAGSGPWPTVLLGFEMFGVTGYLRAVAAQLAADGYGAVTELPADAGGRERGLQLINGLRRDQVEADVRAAIEFLRDRPDCSGEAAMVGLSAGGHIAYYAATRVPLKALAAFYPGWLTGSQTGLSQGGPVLAQTPGLAALRTPVLVLAGADDHLYAPGDLDAIDAALTAAGVVHELIVYPGTPHGFACFERDTYRPEAAADAWERTRKHLARSLGTRSFPLAE